MMLVLLVKNVIVLLSMTSTPYLLLDSQQKGRVFYLTFVPSVVLMGKISRPSKNIFCFFLFVRKTVVMADLL